MSSPHEVPLPEDLSPGEIRRLKKPHKKTWDEVYCKLEGWLHTIAVAMVGHLEAEDVVQQTWSDSLDQIKGFDPRKKTFVEWQIALMREAARRQRPHSRIVPLNQDPPMRTRIEPGNSDQVIVIIEFVRTLLAKLSAADRSLIRRCWQDGLTGEQLGRRLGKSSNAVRKNKHDLRLRIRRVIDRDPSLRAMLSAVDDRSKHTLQALPDAREPAQCLPLPLSSKLCQRGEQP